MSDIKTPSLRKLRATPIGDDTARRLNAARFGPAASFHDPLAEGATSELRRFYSASISLLRSESPETPELRFTMGTGDKGKLRDVGLHGKAGDVVVKGAKKLMLVAIDTERQEVLLLDWNGKKVTLKEGGESVPIGSGKFLLRLERIEDKGTECSSHSEPAHTPEEKAFLKANLNREWRRRYRES